MLVERTQRRTRRYACHLGCGGAPRGGMRPRPSAYGSFAHRRAATIQTDVLLLPNYHLDVNIIGFTAVIELVGNCLEANLPIPREQ